MQVLPRRNHMQSEATSHVVTPYQGKIRMKNLKKKKGVLSGGIPYLTAPSTQVFMQALPGRMQKLLG